MSYIIGQWSIDHSNSVVKINALHSIKESRTKYVFVRFFFHRIGSMSKLGREKSENCVQREFGAHSELLNLNKFLFSCRVFLLLNFLFKSKKRMKEGPKAKRSKEKKISYYLIRWTLNIHKRLA